MVKLIRAFIRFSFPFVKLYWFLFRPQASGAVCLIECDGKFLLVKQAYIKNAQWTIPGGGIKKGETPEAGVHQEVFEEVGITLGDVQKLGEYVSTHEYKTDTVHCFYSSVSNPAVKLDPVEISEAQWFLKDEIPNDTRTSLKKSLEFYKH
jgi:8-oxo-dGTP pyrophosphatase MutT (NUDIX family)